MDLLKLKLFLSKFKLVKFIVGFFRQIPRLRNYRFLLAVPPGHFYSPIPDMKEILLNAESLFERNERECPGIDLREDAQLELFNQLSAYYEERPYGNNNSEQGIIENAIRYYPENPVFRIGDALVLYSFLRHCKPGKVIEIGSGFSSAVMMDTNDLYLDKSVDLTFIEPHPKRFYSMVKSGPESNYRIVEKNVQEVPLELFKGLAKGDFLFVDSSHIAKIGSDVVHIFSNILPALAPGVIVHFHDIPWPFEYPRYWLMNGASWNEAYFLKAFLQFNTSFEILFFNSFMIEFYPDVIKKQMPGLLDSLGLSIWLRKTL